MDNASDQCNDCGCRRDHCCDQFNEWYGSFDQGVGTDQPQRQRTPGTDDNAEPVNEGEYVSVKSEEKLASSASISQHVAEEFNVIESANSFQ